MNIKQTLVSVIKVISTVLISTAIALELWNIYAVSNNIDIPSILIPVFWVERFAVTCHFLEGVIAAFYAPAKKKMPIQYGIYTFFVGTVGLWELFKEKFEVKN
ncbi:unknown protein [Nostoc sp. NIES-3756]|jgi:hypothetical protein|uniref:hypothetical protein n=1 Tax=Nostoc sp. NIES-3756 TaxID=1751286 RepID=UPI00071F053D|nr:hypothetical protein [Nostoc sp. NIES-3756]BAT52342.1 unknown protein [Nostoc sp. NIES-3756]BAY39963.1 hypothetical protein NIES2111_43440 [Nostoc sp. NIES-2111]